MTYTDDEILSMMKDRTLLALKKEKLTIKEKDKLKELNDIIDKHAKKSPKPYLHLGWLVYEYHYPSEFIACLDEKVLRAKTKEEINKLIEETNTVDNS